MRRLDDDRELVRLPGPDQRDFWYRHAHLQPGRRAAVAVYALTAAVATYFECGTWDAGNCSEACEPGGLAFHPDSRRLLFGARGGHRVWDRGERRVVRRLPLDFRQVIWRSIPRAGGSPSTTSMAAPRVAILELETGRVLADWRSQVGNVLWPGALTANCWPIGSYAE